MKPMKSTYATAGTCARFIDIEIADDIVKDVRFLGGCQGNAQGVAALVRGMATAEVIARLQGLECRNRTSCPDQLARALAKLTGRKAS